MWLATNSMVNRPNDAMLCILREYETDGCDLAANIDAGRVSVLNRPSPVTTRPVAMGMHSVAIAALQAAGI
jgi:hypothetical protein